ncbi:hypothetical protein J6590_082302 [Homalodisca vitripennis]|nr:hypothetical protein J6590_082302 [Homalodisca vitripennis]
MWQQNEETQNLTSTYQNQNNDNIASHEDRKNSRGFGIGRSADFKVRLPVEARETSGGNSRERASLTYQRNFEDSKQPYSAYVSHFMPRA